MEIINYQSRDQRGKEIVELCVESNDSAHKKRMSIEKYALYHYTINIYETYLLYTYASNQQLDAAILHLILLLKALTHNQSFFIYSTFYFYPFILHSSNSPHLTNPFFSNTQNMHTQSASSYSNQNWYGIRNSGIHIFHLIFRYGWGCIEIFIFVVNGMHFKDEH